MKHLKVKFAFNEFEPQSKVFYDEELASNPEKFSGLIYLVRSYYHQDRSNWKLDEVQTSRRLYQNLIDVAIKSNNLPGLEILWQGIYFHDQANPDFERDVYTAVEFSDLKTVHHVLYGYMNYMVLDFNEDLDYIKLVQLAEKNPNWNVLRLINHLSICVDDGKIKTMNKKFLDENGEDSVEMKSLAVKFYECIEVSNTSVRADFFEEPKAEDLLSVETIKQLTGGDFTGQA